MSLTYIENTTTGKIEHLKAVIPIESNSKQLLQGWVTANKLEGENLKTAQDLLSYDDEVWFKMTTGTYHSSVDDLTQVKPIETPNLMYYPDLGHWLNQVNPSDWRSVNQESGLWYYKGPDSIYSILNGNGIPLDQITGVPCSSEIYLIPNVRWLINNFEKFDPASQTKIYAYAHTPPYKVGGRHTGVTYNEVKWFAILETKYQNASNPSQSFNLDHRVQMLEEEFTGIMNAIKALSDLQTKIITKIGGVS